MDTKPSATPQDHQTGTGHESTDAWAGMIFAIVFFLGISGIALHFIVAGVQKAFENQRQPRDQWPPVTPARRAATEWTNRLAPLQVNPPVELDAFRAREEAQLHTYGWVNRTAGTVHIPIDAAMDLLAKRGLPARQGTNPPATGPSSWELQRNEKSQSRNPRSE